MVHFLLYLLGYLLFFPCLAVCFGLVVWFRWNETPFERAQRKAIEDLAMKETM